MQAKEQDIHETTPSVDSCDDNRQIVLRKDQLQFHIVSTSLKYRRLARELPGKTDAVLEIGCSTGEATRELATSAGTVLAVDIDPPMVREVQAALAEFTHVKVRKIDGRLGADIAALMPAPDIVFLDIGGNARLDNVACVLRQCLIMFSPRSIVVRSSELAGILALTCEIEPPDKWLMRQIDVSESLGPAERSLIDLSRSNSKDTRLLAVRKFRRLATPGALARLEEMTTDPHPKVAHTATMAVSFLRSLPPQEAG